jgi:ferritin
MNLLYYNTQIKEELEEAAAYIKKACCLKVSNKEKAEKFAKLSQDELSHAKTLFEMFEADYSEEIKRFESIPSFYSDAHKSMNDMYLECYGEIEMMHKSYSEK